MSINFPDKDPSKITPIPEDFSKLIDDDILHQRDIDYFSQQVQEVSNIPSHAEKMQSEAYARQEAEIDRLETGAKIGDADSLYKLGIMYDVGSQGFPKDFQKAAELFTIAAAKGHPDAQFELGIMYAEGIGVAQNSTKAAQLFRAASEQGNIQAKIRLEAMN